jgi:hypothetical protein
MLFSVCNFALGPDVQTLQQNIIHFYDVYHPWVEMIGILLGVAALAFALKQLRDSQRLIRDARRTSEDSAAVFQKVQDITRLSKELSDRVGEITEQTRSIKDEMSTKFVSFFPHNLESVVKLIGSASSCVDIMVDIVGYGHYSAPAKFLDYEKKLKELANAPNVKLRMLVYGQRLTETTRDEQFGGKAKFEEIRSSPEYRRYFKEVHKGVTEPKDYESFIAWLDKMEREYEEQVRGHGALVGSSEKPFRFFLWLVDKSEAAFSFQTYGEHFDEICFRTRDGHMINMFSRLFCDAWAEWEKANAHAQKPSVGVVAPGSPSSSFPMSAPPAGSKQPNP